MLFNKQPMVLFQAQPEILLHWIVIISLIEQYCIVFWFCIFKSKKLVKFNLIVLCCIN